MYECIDKHKEKHMNMKIINQYTALIFEMVIKGKPRTTEVRTYRITQQLMELFYNETHGRVRHFGIIETTAYHDVLLFYYIKIGYIGIYAAIQLYFLFWLKALLVMDYALLFYFFILTTLPTILQ